MYLGRRKESRLLRPNPSERHRASHLRGTYLKAAIGATPECPFLQPRLQERCNQDLVSTFSPISVSKCLQHRWRPPRRTRKPWKVSARRRHLRRFSTHLIPLFTLHVTLLI
eukprot:scaffold3146_cov245-Pinguiococcus_pyrenoidosus.AAC.9